MAFDAAHGSVSASSSSAGSSLLSSLSDRAQRLSATSLSLEKATAQVGTAVDTPAFRQRIENFETTGLRLADELDAGLKRARAGGAGASAADARGIKRIEEQYPSLREKFITAVNAGRIRRREVAPRAADPGAVGDRGGPSISRTDSAGGGVVIELKNFSAVDVALAEEKRFEALQIAREAAALNSIVKDVHGLVHEQEEAVAVVEAQVTSAADRTEAGVRELEIAKTYVSKYRKGWACFCLLAVLAIAVPLTLHFAINPGQVGHI